MSSSFFIMKLKDYLFLIIVKILYKRKAVPNKRNPYLKYILSSTSVNPIPTNKRPITVKLELLFFII